MKDKIVKFESGLTKVVWLVCSIAVMFGCGLVFAITIARYAYGISWEWAEELSRYCIIFAALLGSGPMVFKETHICMSIIPDKIKSEKLLFVYKLVCAVCLLVISALLLVWGSELVSVSNMRSYSLIFPMKAIFTMIPVSMGVIVLYSILKILAVVSDYRNNSKGGGCKA